MLNEVYIYNDEKQGVNYRGLALYINKLTHNLAEIEVSEFNNNNIMDLEIYLSKFVEDHRQHGWLIADNPESNNVFRSATIKGDAFKLNHPKYSYLLVFLHKPELLAEAMIYLGLKANDIQGNRGIITDALLALDIKRKADRINVGTFKPIIRKEDEEPSKTHYGVYSKQTGNTKILDISIVHQEATDNRIGYVPNRIHYPTGMNPLFRGKGLFPKIMFEIAKQCQIISSGGFDRSEAATEGWRRLIASPQFEKISGDDWDFLLYKRGKNYKDLKEIVEKILT